MVTCVYRYDQSVVFSLSLSLSRAERLSWGRGGGGGGGGGGGVLALEFVSFKFGIVVPVKEYVLQLLVRLLLK